MLKTIVITGALDTKGEEFAFVEKLIRARGLNTCVIDFGVIGEPRFKPDIDNDEVARAGGSSIDKLRNEKDKADAMRVMKEGLIVIVRKLYEQGNLQGIIGMGGSGGTSIATAAMRALPIGIPKLIVSTVGGGDVAPYVGTRDISIMPSVVDVAGINRISRLIYANAAGAIAGMVETEMPPFERERPLIAASMFGNTTSCVERARARLESKGFEVLVFHATGTGGRTMQSLVEDGFITGLFDITTTELADEVCGGVFSAGPERVNIAATKKVPVVFAPGCVDMCNFAALSTVPGKYHDRNLYEWNANVTLLRTNVEENIRIGRMLAATANMCAGPAAVILPTNGVSMLDSPGGPFWDPTADRACFDTIKQNLRQDICVVEVDANINDPEFADKAADLMLKMLIKESQSQET